MTDRERAEEWLLDEGRVAEIGEGDIKSLAALIAAVRAEGEAAGAARERERCAELCRKKRDYFDECQRDEVKADEYESAAHFEMKAAVAWVLAREISAMQEPTP
jgi:hypothetical protein